MSEFNSTQRVGCGNRLRNQKSVNLPPFAMLDQPKPLPTVHVAADDFCQTKPWHLNEGRPRSMARVPVSIRLVSNRSRAKFELQQDRLRVPVGPLLNRSPIRNSDSYCPRYSP